MHEVRADPHADRQSHSDVLHGIGSRVSERTAHTQHTTTDLDKLEALLLQARRNAYASNREELFIGDMTIAAPVLDSERRPVASVHVVAPTSRWTFADAQQRLAPAVIDCARGISKSIRTLS